MFGEYVYENSPASYSNLILIFDSENLNGRIEYASTFASHGFLVVEYENDLSFRIEYEEKIKRGNIKIAVLNTNGAYVPYDIMKCFSIYTISLQNLFPKLNKDVLLQKSKIDFDLLAMVASRNYEKLVLWEHTEKFFQTVVYDKSNLQTYFAGKMKQLLEDLVKDEDYTTWFSIAETKALIDLYSTKYELNIDTSRINASFQSYVLRVFGTLSSKINHDTPVLASRTMEYIHEQSEKFVIIVMDGMSEFDWNIISKTFDGIQYKQSAMFAMIPSTTSVSRQCLLSNKFPNQLLSPWNQSKEKNEFIDCARSLGYTDRQIGYARGYDVEFDAFVRCGAVIINDIDDMVHAQLQGRIGMYNDISVLANEGRLRKLTERLLAKGFDVYITADHGNTLCSGIGKYVGAGVDVETKSHRMLVLKDIADKKKMIDKFELVEYPKYYLPREFDYLICDTATSLDAAGQQVMTHGGMTIDEVVVPFIMIKAGKIYG